jgi:hypothetical protein
MLPNQLQAILAEQNRQIIDKFNIIQKQSSLCYSAANSVDGDSYISNSNALQIPTISTANNNNTMNSNTTSNIKPST